MFEGGDEDVKKIKPFRNAPSAYFDAQKDIDEDKILEKMSRTRRQRKVINDRAYKRFYSHYG